MPSLEDRLKILEAKIDTHAQRHMRGGPDRILNLPLGSAPAFLDTKVARKTSNESVTNSAVLQNDDDLFIDGEGGSVWCFECHLFQSAGTTAPDIKIKWSVPSGCTMKWGADSPGTEGMTVLTETTERTWNVAVASTYKVLRGLIIFGGTPGRVRLQWAQNAATAGVSTTLEASSFLVAWRIA